MRAHPPKGSFLIQSSAGFAEGCLEGSNADIVFPGTGGLGSQTDAYRKTYWRGRPWSAPGGPLLGAAAVRRGGPVPSDPP